MTAGVAVHITGDTTIEPDETFNLIITDPGIFTVSDGQGTATIINDDNPPLSTTTTTTTTTTAPPPTTTTTAPPTTTTTTTTAPPPPVGRQVSIANRSKVEGNTGTSTIQMVLTLNGPATGNETVIANTVALSGSEAAAAGSDYVPVINRLVTFPAGDTTVEPDERFTLRLTNPSGATLETPCGTANGIIKNND